MEGLPFEARSDVNELVLAGANYVAVDLDLVADKGLLSLKLIPITVKL